MSENWAVLLLCYEQYCKSNKLKTLKMLIIWKNHLPNAIYYVNIGKKVASNRRQDSNILNVLKQLKFSNEHPLVLKAKQYMLDLLE